MQLTEQEIKDFNFMPRGVVESKFNFKLNKASHVAEVSFYGAHYILSEPLKSIEEARTIADKKALEMKEAMLKAGFSFVADLKQAKTS